MNIEDFVPFPNLTEEFTRKSNIKFEADRFVPIPRQVVAEGINIRRRERFAGLGLVDNVRIELEKKDSFVLGQFLIGCQVYSEFESYDVYLPDSEKIKTIRIETSRNSNLQVSLDFMGWNYFSVPSGCSNGILNMFLTSDTDIIGMDSWNERDILKGFGGFSGGLLMAHKLLQFAVDDMNYETIFHHEEDHPAVDPKNSCELRLELPGLFE